MADLGDILDEAKDLVGDHSSEIKDGIDKAADLVEGRVAKDSRTKVRDVASTAKGLVDEVAGTKKKPGTNKKKSGTKKRSGTKNQQ